MRESIRNVSRWRLAEISEKSGRALIFAKAFAKVSTISWSVPAGRNAIFCDGNPATKKAPLSFFATQIINPFLHLSQSPQRVGSLANREIRIPLNVPLE